MKIIISSLLIVLACISASGQQFTKQDYLKKSKNQKSLARILTTGGGLLVVGGIVSYASESNTSFYPGKEVGNILMASAAVVFTGGIILFSASKRNERKAGEVPAMFKMKLESSEMYRYKAKLGRYYPALAIKLNIR